MKKVENVRDDEQEKWKRLYQESYLKTIESYNWSGRSLALSGDTSGALLASVKAGELLKQPGVPVKLTYQIIIALRERLDEFGAISQQLEGGHSYVSCLAFSPDGSILASGNWDKTINLWDVTTRQLQHSFSSDPDPVYSLAFSPDGSLLASGTWNNTVKLWDVENGKEKDSLCEPLAFLNSLSVSLDDQVLAFGSWNQTIALWDLQTNKLVARLSGHAKDVSSLCFSPDGTILVSGDLAGAIKLWHVSNGQEKATLRGPHASRIKKLTFPNKSTLISINENRIKTFWDFENGLIMGTSEDQDESGETIEANPSQASIELENISIGRNPDSSISVRNRQNDRKIFKIIDDNAPTINSLSFSPDGTRLAAGSSDHRILLWDLSAFRKNRNSERAYGGSQARDISSCGFYHSGVRAALMAL